MSGAVPIEMPKGSVVFFTEAVWHLLGEDDWFDTMDGIGRDHVRLAHMATLHRFTDQQRRQILDGAAAPVG